MYGKDGKDIMQDNIFSQYEGNHYYERNKQVLNTQCDDHIMNVIKFLRLNPKNVAEVGCFNGFRLELVRQEFNSKCWGIDASKEAIEAGRKEYPDIELHQGTVAEACPKRKFDLVICNFVLHWVDREVLLQSVAKIDALVQWGGTVILGDFLPDYQQKRKYHHLPELDVFTYKQDYGKIFISSGLYSEIYRYIFNHDHSYGSAGWAPSSQRGMCVVLRKMKNDEYYPLV